MNHMKAFLVALALVGVTLAMSGCATPPSGGPTATQSDPFAAIKTFTLTDLKAASADAHAQSPPDQTAYQCYDFLISWLPTLPSYQPGQAIGAITVFQKGRDLVGGASATQGALTKLNLACAPLVISVQTTLTNLGLMAAGTAATGGALAPLGGLLPIKLP